MFMPSSVRSRRRRRQTYLPQERFQPLTYLPRALHDAVEHERVTTRELFGGLATREDRHRAFLLRVRERTVGDEQPALVELLPMCRMRRLVERRLRQVSGLVEQDVLQTATW